MSPKLASNFNLCLNDQEQGASPQVLISDEIAKDMKKAGSCIMNLSVTCL